MTRVERENIEVSGAGVREDGKKKQKCLISSKENASKINKGTSARVLRHCDEEVLNAP